MASTTSKGFPYPQATDPVDVPSDIYNLANKIDSLLTDTAVVNTIPLRGTSGVVTVGTPTSGSHAVTKTYADAITTSLTSLVQTTVPLTTTGDLLYASASGFPATSARLGIGTNGYVLAVVGGVPTWTAPNFTAGTGTGTGFVQTSGTLSANTATTIDTLAISGFIGIEYLLNMKQGTKARASTIRVVTDGTSAVSSEEYGIAEVGGIMTGVSVVASLSSTNSILQVTVTDASATNVTWRLSKLAL